ncbi:MAG: diphosphomevalonate decarboxylase [Anaerolineaceae bacterium]|nr:diphosphomevalonate decarboxylase [Anaerolineaceae bacterium]
MIHTATARAHANIAFIKYWGNRDEELRLPENSSLSMNLDGLYTETTVIWNDAQKENSLVLNNQPQLGQALERVVKHLDNLRKYVPSLPNYANVISTNNFPMGAGIASSASSFAALTLASISAANITLSERTLSTLARLGSGSASRSIPTGFVEWHRGDDHESSYAETIASPDYWDLVDIIVVVSDSHKKVGSTEGHQSARTSDLQEGRLKHVDNRLKICKEALLNRDFESFSEVIEEDSNLMHSVMMTSRPPLFYWQPASVAIMQQVKQWRQDGLRVCYTLDAGPNVHCICVRKDVPEVIKQLKTLSAILDIRVASAGSGAYIVQSDEVNSQ